ncbi:hypothetical protein MA16_Dca017316 [Dendrobium catenatum]|uniref:Uncharacterized protein n=1 Tax=Dendrobium catenatum TaxID=906689 RepID=A0A2I0XG53_9ASPA|nr:hypothetical protein MA16_Dca017316 [Dendrobium catenatum]
MEERIGLKRPRPIVGDDEVENPPQQRKPRFPKGKKLKVEGRLDVADGFDGDSNVQIGPNFAAKERAKRRIERKETDLFGRTADFTDFEVQYEARYQNSVLLSTWYRLVLELVPLSTGTRYWNSILLGTEGY